jgi:hypothetical protein
MLKRLAVFAIAAFLTSCVFTYAAGGGTKNKVDPQTNGQNDNQAGQKTPSVVVQEGSQQANASESEEKNDTDQKLAEYTRWLAIFTAVLALVSIAQGYFLYVHGVELRTLAGAAKENTAAAKDGASFALLNAQAVINAERAWIMVQPTSSKRGVYTFLAQNVGQTPAKLITSFADFIVLGHTTNPPATPDYKTQRLEGMTPTLCLPKDMRIIFEISADAIGRIKYPRGDAPPNHLEFMEIYFFGKIVYEDTLNTGKTPESNPLHETKWCFKLLPVDGGVAIADARLIPRDYVDYS